MKEVEKIDCYGFLRELKSIPAMSKKLKITTAKRKVEAIYDKYSDLISYDVESKERFRQMYRDLEKVVEAMKTGVVNYNGGFFRVSEIERITFTETNIKVYFKSGCEDNFSKDFDWLKKLVF